MNVCMYVCMYVCMHACIHYIHVHTYIIIFQIYKFLKNHCSGTIVIIISVAGQSDLNTNMALSYRPFLDYTCLGLLPFSYLRLDVFPGVPPCNQVRSAHSQWLQDHHNLSVAYLWKLFDLASPAWAFQWTCIVLENSSPNFYLGVLFHNSFLNTCFVQCL